MNENPDAEYRVPHVGPKGYRMSMVRREDDFVPVNGELVNVLRASIGGTADMGFYLQFRGEPDKVLEMLDLVKRAADDMLPRGNYKDERPTLYDQEKNDVNP